MIMRKHHFVLICESICLGVYVHIAANGNCWINSEPLMVAIIVNRPTTLSGYVRIGVMCWRQAKWNMNWRLWAVYGSCHLHWAIPLSGYVDMSAKLELAMSSQQRLSSSLANPPGRGMLGLYWAWALRWPLTLSLTAGQSNVKFFERRAAGSCWWCSKHVTLGLRLGHPIRPQHTLFQPMGTPPWRIPLLAANGEYAAN